MIICCACKKQYEFVPFKGSLELPVLLCPHCGSRHTIEFKTTEDRSDLVPTQLRLTAAKPVLTATRILDADRTALAADNTDYTVNKGTKPNLIYVVQLDEEKGAWASTYKLQWKNTTDSGGFADLAATGEINYSATTNLAQGTAVTSRACTTAGASGSTWQNGEEVEGASTSDSINLADEYYTEVHFAINCASAKEGKTYDFQVIESGGGTAIGSFASSLIITSDQPSVVLNTADEYDFGTDTTPTLEFTGTDPSDSDVRYNIQINTEDVWTTPLIDKVSGTDPGFANTTDGVDTDPFDSGDKCDYDVSYPVVNFSPESLSSYYSLYAGVSYVMGQSFQSPSIPRYLRYVEFKQQRLGSPTGNVIAKLWAHTGSFGSSSKPTGGALATSDAVDITSIPSVSPGIIRFTFSIPYLLDASTYYVISCSSNNGNSSNLIRIFYSSSGGHEGNLSYSSNESAWSVIAGEDVGFILGLGLDAGTYYWRVRAIDPSPGSGTYGSWTTARSFSISSGATTYTKEASLNALIQKTGITKTSSLGALIQKSGITKTASLDALKAALVAIDADLDALIGKTNIVKTSDMDGLLQKAGLSQYANLNALIQRSGLTSAASLNALLQKSGITSVASLNALLEKGVLKTTFLDSLIQLAGIEKTADIDAYLSIGKTSATEIDAYLQALLTIALSFDALIKKTGVAQTAQINAILQKQGIEAASIIDALIQLAGIEKTADMDAIIQKAASVAADLDAYLQAVAFVASDRCPHSETRFACRLWIGRFYSSPSVHNRFIECPLDEGENRNELQSLTPVFKPLGRHLPIWTPACRKQCRPWLTSMP